MGIEDRDWYREETAKKQGMLYNRKNATYRADPRYFPKLFRGSATVRAERRRASRSSLSPKTMHQLLVALATFAICGGIFFVLKVVSQILR